MFDRFLDWFERHKIGVVGTLMLHTFLMFGFAMSKVGGKEDRAAQPPPLELELEAPPPEPTPEELQQQEELAAQDLQNRVSDMNADPARALSSTARDRITESVEEDLKALEQAEFQRLAEQRTLEGKDIVVPTLDPTKFDKKNYLKESPRAVKVEGNVTVRVNVPGRENTSVDVPAYLCKGRGQVLVRVSVDRSGAVTKAEVDPSGTNTTDDCLLSHAVESATGARFASAGSGPSPGTIQYTFVAQ